MAIRSREKGESSSTITDMLQDFKWLACKMFCLHPAIKDTAHNDYPPSRWTSRNLRDNEVVYLFFDLLSCYERENGMVRSMAAGKDGLLYTSASNSANMRFWNRGKPIGFFPAEYGPNYALLLDTRGHVYVGSSDGRVRIWEVGPAGPPAVNRLHDLPWLDDGMNENLWRKKMEVLEESKRSNWHHFAVTCMSFSEVSEDSPTYLYTGSTDCSIKVWSLRDSTLVDVLKKHTKPVCSVAAGCGDRMFSGSEDGSLHMWLRKRTATEPYDIYHTVTDALMSGEVPVYALFLRSTTTGFNTQAGRSELFAGLKDGTVLVWKERPSFPTSRVETLRGHEDAVTCLAGSRGHLVFSGSKDGNIRAWSNRGGTKDYRCVFKLNAHEGRVNCIAVHEDWDDYLAVLIRRYILYSGGEDKMVKTWRIRHVDEV